MSATGMARWKGAVGEEGGAFSPFSLSSEEEEEAAPAAAAEVEERWRRKSLGFVLLEVKK
jgi:hypothetical protein